MDHLILKVLVGSQAHGLSGPESDADHRGVYVMPTVEMFRLTFKYQGVRWMEAEGKHVPGARDETLWEVGHFLALGIQCHPLILETLLGPVVVEDAWGVELRG